MTNDGVRYISIEGGYKVFTQRVGRGPIKLLLLHGGPGSTHEQFECFPEFLSQYGIELFLYDQLGSHYSDQPDNPLLWTVERFCEEVEQVRLGLGLDRFYLLGHSWGGMLAIEYALKYQHHLKALVVSSMTGSIASYIHRINELRGQLPSDIITRMTKYEQEHDFDAPAYKDMLVKHLYEHYVCRRIPWPKPVSRAISHLAMPVYSAMQGPNEFMVTGTIAGWDRWADLKDIRVPTLLIAGQHDTIRTSDVEEMSKLIPRATVEICPEGSHLSCWDDQSHYFPALTQFLVNVERASTSLESQGEV